MIDEETWMVLRALYRQGWNITELAREFGINWRTARPHAEADEPPRYTPRPCPADLTDEQLAFVKRRLGVCASLRATTLYREVTELGYAGSYPSFARRVRSLRGEQPAEPSVRFETDPGGQTQMDWCDLGRWPLGRDVVELKALVGILGFSRHVAMRFATDQTRATTLELLPWVVHELGGVTQEILTDRDPVFVVGETSDKRAIFAPECVDLTMTLATTPRACRPYRAQTNALAESVIGLYKTELIRNKGPWRGLDDVEFATLEWVDWWNNRRLLGPIGMISPAEAEAAYYSQDVPVTGTGTQETESL
jgi:transposase